MSKLNMPSSHYHIEYVEGKEWDYHIFRGKEDVTKELKNNLVSDMFYTMLEMQEKSNETN